MKKKNILIGLVIWLSFSLSNINAQNYMIKIPELTGKQLSIIPIAGFTAKGEMQNLKSALSEGLDAGLNINEIKEILVQLYASAGFPRSLNAINGFETVLKERRKRGIEDTAGREPSQQKFKNGKFEYGKAVLTSLTGSTETGPAQKFVPVIDTFLKEHLFADIFSRNNLDYTSREIATISALASLTNTENQLKSHLKVGKNIGLTEKQLRQIASTVVTRIGLQEGSAINRILDELDGVPSADSVIQGSEITVQKLSDTIFSKGNLISGEHFTGSAWLNWLVPNDSIYNCPVGSVTFEPGARTNWHKHPGGQILLVTGGQGYYQERGKPVQMIKKGDVITIGPDIEHWHGATANSWLTHVAINTNVQKGSTVWLKPVRDEEYNNMNKK